MILTDLLTQVNIAFRGSDDDVPATGSVDSDLWIGTVNRKIQEWARDSKNTWQSNFLYSRPNEPGTVATEGTTTLTGTDTYFLDYQVGDKITVDGETVRTIATITSNTVLTVTVAFSNTDSAKSFTHQPIIKTATQSYNLHRRFLAPSDTVVVTTATQDTEYVIGKPQERERYVDEVYISGNNPKSITFYEDIESTDSIVGGELFVPGFYFPDELTLGTDVIPVDDPYWLVYAVASELAFNDLTYESKANDLNTKANNLYIQMAQANRRGTSNNPRIIRTNVNRIVGPSSERTQ